MTGWLVTGNRIAANVDDAATGLLLVGLSTLFWIALFDLIYAMWTHGQVQESLVDFLDKSETIQEELGKYGYRMTYYRIPGRLWGSTGFISISRCG